MLGGPAAHNRHWCQCECAPGLIDIVIIKLGSVLPLYHTHPCGHLLRFYVRQAVTAPWQQSGFDRKSWVRHPAGWRDGVWVACPADATNMQGGHWFQEQSGMLLLLAGLGAWWHQQQPA